MGNHITTSTIGSQASPKAVTYNKFIKNAKSRTRSSSSPLNHYYNIKQLKYTNNICIKRYRNVKTSCYTFPDYGVRASAGRRSRMEDAVSVIENLISVPNPELFLNIEESKTEELNGSIQSKINNHINTKDKVLINGNENEEEEEEEEGENFHFFGVFDGHNGPYAAHHCRGRLHENIRSIYLDHFNTMNHIDPDHLGIDLKNHFTTSSETSQRLMNDERNHIWKSSHNRCGSDQVLAASKNTITPLLYSMTSNALPIPSAEEIMLEAFRRTDKQFGDYRCSTRVGTTALIALVGSNYLCVGSCGDSRAVLYRDGQPIQMSNDHRLDRLDEKSRIESAGGKVTYMNGPRVMGVLAMSRAIGDMCFRRYGVICDPEVSSILRDDQDEFFIMATDGLWDVVANEEAYLITRRVLRSAKRKIKSDIEGGGDGGSQLAANKLTELAYDRGSRDNITVVVIDLKRT